MKRHGRSLLWDSAISVFFIATAVAAQGWLENKPVADVIVSTSAAVRSVPPPLTLPVQKKIRSSLLERSEMRPQPSLH